MLDPLQFYCRVLCNGMKMRFRMVMIAHPGPGIGFHKRFMWWIIILPAPYKFHLSEADLVTGGPAHKLSPSLLVVSHIWAMGELVVTETPQGTPKAPPNS